MRLPGRFVKGDHKIVEEAFPTQQEGHLGFGKDHGDGESKTDFDDEDVYLMDPPLDGAHLAAGDAPQNAPLAFLPLPAEPAK